VRGPPITVSCHCGRVEHVPYGEAWTCEHCGRRWNTAQIPEEDYWGIMRAMRNYRLVIIGIAVGLALVFGTLALVVSEGLILLLPVVLTFWFIWFMPCGSADAHVSCRRGSSLPNSPTLPTACSRS
jgi:hypothetical protein